MMTGDIFKLFKKSIETIAIKKITRGTLDITTTYEADLDCIVKRRDGTDDGTNESELYKNSTTIHFKPEDSQYVELGNYVEINGVWRNITFIKAGKNFHNGKLEFLWATVGNEILDSPNSPDWSMPSA
jgi:hypothetical protein